MKVILCSPHKGKVGGITIWTNYILDYFSEHQSEIDLKIVDMSRSQAITPDMPLWKRIIAGIKDFSSITKKIKKQVVSYNADIIHLVSTASISLIKDLLIIKWARRKKISTIIHFHFGRIPEILMKNNWERKMLEMVLKKADKIIVIDGKSLKALQDLGFSNIYYVPNPLSPKVVDFINNQNLSKIERKKNKIIFAGHVIPSKGIFELVKACLDIDNVELSIIGSIDNTMNDRLRDIIGNNSEKIRVLGEQNHMFVLKEMLSAYIFCLPSYTEGFPNVILESMAAGCCIISTEVGAIPEMLQVEVPEKKCGICVPPRNIKYLKNTIYYCINNEDITKQFMNNAVHRVNEEYSIHKIWKQLNEIWIN